MAVYRDPSIVLFGLLYFMNFKTIQCGNILNIEDRDIKPASFETFSATTFHSAKINCSHKQMRMATHLEIGTLTKDLPKNQYWTPIVAVERKKYFWIDGTRLDQHHKYPQTKQNQDCGFLWLDNAVIDGESCGNKMSFLCEGSLKNPPVNVAKLSAFNKEYWVFKETKSWIEAKRICSCHGTRLAVLSYSDEDKLKQFAKKISELWNLERVSIGLYRYSWKISTATEENYVYIDDKEWGPGGPAAPLPGRAVTIILPSNMLKTAPVNSSYPVICVPTNGTTYITSDAQEIIAAVPVTEGSKPEWADGIQHRVNINTGLLVVYVPAAIIISAIILFYALYKQIMKIVQKYFRQLKEGLLQHNESDKQLEDHV